MAEMILGKYGGGRFTARSAGLFSSGCSRMTPNAEKVLSENGFDEDEIRRFVSHKLTAEDIIESDIVIGVTSGHADMLRSRFPEFSGKITTFDVPVNDLWEDEDSYRECYEALKSNILKMFSLREYNITVRDMDMSGASQSAALEEECFSHPWRLCDYEKARTDAAYICLCAYADGVFAGFMMAYTVADECNLLDIATLPAYRGKGVATALVGELKTRLEALGANKIFLEARTKNTPARSLYEKLGFKSVGVRKNYYKDPPDDAVLYTLTLGGNEEK